MGSNWRERLSVVGEAYLAGGDSEAIDLTLRRVVLNGGSSFEPQKSGVTVIVGANNAGKSTLLREIASHFTYQVGQVPGPGIALQSIEVENSGSQADLVAWVAERLRYQEEPGYRGFVVPEWGNLPATSIGTGWGAGSPALGQLSPYLVFHGDAQGRFGVGGSAEMRSAITDPASSPIHHLQDSKTVMDAMAAVTQRIFGKSLTLDNLGRTLRLRVGTIDVAPPPINAISDEYLAAMASLPSLDEQGDGMRSVMGQLLPLVTASHKLILLDEPEAFLHPPQAHALGGELARLSATGAQVVIATHDRNLLSGLLEEGVPITVVRLSRDESFATAHQLDAESLRALWSDPVLHYSNVLDGLFHRLVVVAEADGDCAFLAAALASLSREDSLPPSEVLFVPTGGKAGMSKVCQALRALDVPVVAAPDLDIISDVGLLRGLVESMGTPWSESLQAVWNQATANLRAPRDPVKCGDVLRAVEAILQESEADNYTRDYRDKINAAIRSGDSPWAEVKLHGLNAFRGESYSAVIELMSLLAAAAIVPVFEGELERLAPAVAVRKGPAWLSTALAQGEQNNRATQEHLDRIMSAALS